ncbi:MAG: hypothetical protein JWL96_3190 [Sphingomonas bacterium]|nr:hypothetical protein [Sphingomonas bacterium]
MFWAGLAFDYTIPFRAILAEIAAKLGLTAAADLDLPAYEEGEDFIEGTLHFHGTTLATYYEYSLGYLTLASDDRDALEEVIARIESVVVVG